MHKIIFQPKERCKAVKNLSKAIQLIPVFLAILLISGCNNPVGQKNQSTVSVIGTGTVLVKPDMIRMNISLNKTAPTTKSAQEEVNKMVRQALDVLAEFNIEEKSINTASLTFSPEYEYRSNRRTLTGQNARQTITFSIDDIRSDSEKVSQIIDRIVQINGIELNQLDFNVKDNTEYFVKSRELAFQKASDKAKQYAALSGLTVAKVLSISEEGNQQTLPFNNRLLNQSNFIAEMSPDASSTVLPSGELEITTKILAEFLLE